MFVSLNAQVSAQNILLIFVCVGRAKRRKSGTNEPVKPHLGLPEASSQ